jgi:signal transduction histidine kinase
LNSLSGRFLVLTIIFVMLAEVLIFFPSVARFREDFLLSRLERAQIASLALLADDMIGADLEEELLRNAEVFNVVLRRDAVRQLVLSSPMPRPIDATFDLRDTPSLVLIRDAFSRMIETEPDVIRVIGAPVREAGLLIEISMPTESLRAAMLEYGVRILVLSAVISVFTATLLFLAVQYLLVRPIRGVVDHMQRYAAAPEDARRIIEPTSRVTELREAEDALQKMQMELTQALKQKERLSHDLRNILTSAQLFTDRIEMSEDPVVQRMAPKLVGSITRAVNLCESTLAFGKAEEPAPKLTRFTLSDIVNDVIASERLAVGEHDLSFSENIPAAMNVRADPEQLYRVISNLVRNARQAILATGKSGEIAVIGRDEDEHWFIDVHDTGPGLPPKARTHLFTPFQGGARKGGTGLGLAIAAELIRGHGGALELVSSDAAGTRFQIALPKGDVAVV